MNILSKSENFQFLCLNNTEENKYAYYDDLHTIISNYNIVLSYFKEYLYEESSLDSFIDLLFLRKINTYDNPELELDKNKEDEFKELVDLSQSKGNVDFNKVAIQFINTNFKTIFTADIYQLEEAVVNLIFQFQSGVDKKVFKYLIDENKYLLFNNYEEISKKFEKDIELLSKLFSDSNILEFCNIRLNEIINIYRCLVRKKDLEEVSKRVIDGIIRYGHSIKNNFEDRNLLGISTEIEKIYELLNFEKHIEANGFKIISEELRVKLDQQLMKNGKVYSQEIPVSEIVNQVMNDLNTPFKILNLTHVKINVNDDIKSQLDFKSKGKVSLIDDFIGSNNSDDYFTHSHKLDLNVVVSVGAATLHYLFINDDNYFEKVVECYNSVLFEINTKIPNFEIINREDFDMLIQMIFNLKINKNGEAIILQSQSYSICIFICSFIEKILREFYFYLVKDTKYIPINKITMSDLIDSKKNPEMLEVFGENHLKHLKYFLLSEGEKKIGFDYRNKLAHWRDLKWEEMNSDLVFKLFYLFTDVLNTICIHIVSEPSLDQEDELKKGGCS